LWYLQSEPVSVFYWRYKNQSYSHNITQILASQLYLHEKYIIYSFAKLIAVSPYQQPFLQSLQLNFRVSSNQN
jgi:hypothetical protein